MLKWIKSQRYPEGIDYETDQRLVLIVLGISLFATVLLFAAGISRELVLILGFILAGTFFLALRGRLEIAGILGPLGGLAICTLLAFKNFGIRDTAILGLPVVIVAASLMNGQKGAIISGVASLLVIIGLGVAEFSGLVSNIFSPHNTLADYMVACLVIILIVAMQWAVIARLMDSIRLKHQELTERLRAEQEKAAYVQEMETLYQLSLELSELPAEASLDAFFAQKIKDLTQAFFVTLSEYNPAEKRLENRQVIVENQILNQIVNLLGTDPRKMNLPVSEEDYQKIISEVVGYCDTLTEATFGAISPAVGHPLQKLFGVEQFIGLAILYKGELEATMLIVFQKGKAVPSQRFFQSLANLAAVAFWRKKADQARQESETRFQQMAELLPQGIFECNRDGFITYANQQAALMFGFPYFYRHIHFLEVFGEDQRERMLQKLQAVVNGSTTGQHEYHLARQDGSVFPALIRSSPVTKNGQVIGILGAIVDITEFKQVEQKLQRSNRFLRATSRCNLALVHAADSQSLFNEICSTLVEENGYRFAWIGLFEEDERGAPAIKPVANAGLSGISLTTVNPTCGLSLLDCSPMLEAIQSKEPVVIEDIITDIRCQVCREEAVIQNLKSLISLPLIYSGKIFGGITVYASHQDSFSPDEIKVLQEMSSDVAFGIHTLQVRTDRDQAITRLEEVNRELSEAYDATLQGWSKALELRERETAGHSQRVVKLTLALAEKMGIPEKQFNDIRWGAYLHDIGKIGIPDAILLKPGKLTEDEWSVMRLHPEYAYKLVSSIPFLKNAAEIPHLHHERWNGSGYPFQLKGEAIPLAARIFAVVDVWDALTYDRPYRLAWSANESKKYLCENAGTLFDPEIIPIFLELIEGETGEKT